jgi:hypothetical protein
MLRQTCFKENINDSALLSFLIFVQKSWADNAKSLMFFHIIHVCFNLFIIFSVFVMSLM